MTVVHHALPPARGLQSSPALGSAPLYAAGAAVAGALLLGGWGVTHSMLEGTGPFDADGRTQAEMLDAGDLIALPDADHDGVPDAYQALEDSGHGGGNGVAPDGDGSTTREPEDDASGSGSDFSQGSQTAVGPVGRGDEDMNSGIAPSVPPRGGDSVWRDAPRKAYTIQKGDTLSEISGDIGVPVDTLVKINDIKDPNLIYAGSALLIPQI